MKRILALALSLLFVMPSHALSSYKASYDLYAALGFGSLKIGTVQFKLEANDTQFVYTSEASVSPIWRALYDYSRSEKSIGLITNDDLIGSYYYQFERKDGTVENDYEINIFSEQNYATFNNEKNWKVRPGSIVDELSVYLALSHNIKTNQNRKSLIYQVANEEGIKNQEFVVDSSETIEIGDNEIETIKVLCPEMKLTLNLSAEHNFLPVLISKINGNHFKLILTDYEQLL